jgi:pimeloyl-ACP methyl ester carboxylesterase
MEQRTLNTGRFAGLEYWVQGNGPVLMWVHGFAEDHRIWDPVLAEGIVGVKHIIPNLPGTGLSPLVSDSLSLSDIAMALHEILLQEQEDTCVLLGHSMGGYIAAAFAEQYPSCLRGLGLIHSSVYADDDTKKANRNKGIDIVQKGGKAHFFQQLVPALYSIQSQNTLGEAIKQHINMAMAVSDQSICAYYAAMRDRPDRTSMLRSIRVPVLYVLGAEDQSVPLAAGLQQSTLPAYCMVEVLPNVAHTAMNETPQILAKILNKYCQLVLALKKS